MDFSGPGSDLTLPTNLAVAAGFHGTAADNANTPDQGSDDQQQQEINIPTDYFHGESTPVPPQIAAAMGVDQQGNFRQNVPIATLQLARGGGSQGGNSNATTSDEGAAIAANEDTGQPHPYLTSPEFAPALKQASLSGDWRQARSIYKANADGRDLGSDIKLQAGLERKQAGNREEIIKGVASKIVAYDPITGEPFKAGDKQDAETVRKLGGGDPTYLNDPNNFDQAKQSGAIQPLDDIEKAAINKEGGFQRVFGVDIKNKGMQLPPEVAKNPTQAQMFRPAVQAVVQQDRSATDLKTKIQNAATRVRASFQKEKISQNNPAVSDANPSPSPTPTATPSQPGLFDRLKNSGYVQDWAKHFQPGQ